MPRPARPSAARSKPDRFTTGWIRRRCCAQSGLYR
jgi:hypothetical protein